MAPRDRLDSPAHPERPSEPQRRRHAAAVREGRDRPAGTPAAAPRDLRRRPAGPRGGTARGGDPGRRPRGRPRSRGPRAAPQVDPVDQRRGGEARAAPAAGRRADQRERRAHPKGGEYAMTALLMLNHGVPHFVTRQRERRWDPIFMTPIAGPHGGDRRRGPDRRGGGAPGAALRDAGPGGAAERPPASVGPPDVHDEGPATALRQADFVVVTTPLTPRPAASSARRSSTACRSTPAS